MAVEVVQQFPAPLCRLGWSGHLRAATREQLSAGADAHGRGSHVGSSRLEDPPIFLAAVTAECSPIPRRAGLIDSVAEV